MIDLGAITRWFGCKDSAEVDEQIERLDRATDRLTRETIQLHNEVTLLGETGDRLAQFVRNVRGAAQRRNSDNGTKA